VNQDEIDRQFSLVTGGLDSASLLVDGWSMSERADDDGSEPRGRIEPRRLGTLRLIVGVSIILTLAAGWWLRAANGLMGEWAMRSVLTYWAFWVFVAVPLVALATAVLAARILDVATGTPPDQR
jgi:hypothetical protein